MSTRAVAFAAGTVAKSAAEAAVAATEATAYVGTSRMRAGVANMPTRAIAEVLLRQTEKPMKHETLYEEAAKSGLMRSRTHFKHCLRMMKDQNRVKVICLGPEKPGSAKRKFSVGLTRKGVVVYSMRINSLEREQAVEVAEDMERRSVVRKPGMTDVF